MEIKFPNATQLQLSFDESSEVRSPTDVVRFFSDASMTVQLGEPAYGGSVFRGNWPGSRPNPFKPARPPLVVMGDTVVVQAKAEACTTGDWGWKLYVSGDIPSGAAPVMRVIDGDSARTGPVPAGSSPVMPVTTSAPVMAQHPEWACVTLRQPRQLDGSATVQYLERMCAQTLQTYDLAANPWSRKCEYQRPAPGDCVGAGVCSLIESALQDTMIGDSKKLGWMFLYELCVRSLRLSATNR